MKIVINFIIKYFENGMKPESSKTKYNVDAYSTGKIQGNED